MQDKANISIERAEEIMRLCQQEAEIAILEGNVPIACAITDMDGVVVLDQDGTPLIVHNTQNTDCDPTAHAEINGLRRLGKLKQSRYLEGYVIHSNAQTCSMCMSGAIKAGIRNFYYGAPAEPSMDPSISMEDIAARSKHPITITGGILGDECVAQIARGREQINRLKDPNAK